MGNNTSSITPPPTLSDEPQLWDDHSEVINAPSFSLNDEDQHDWSAISESQVRELREKVENRILIRPYETQQWACRVLGFSSQYSSSWSADNVTGESDTFPKYGDMTSAWAPKSSSGSKEFLVVQFEKNVLITQVHIYETFNPGAVVKVSCLPADMEHKLEIAEVIEDQNIDQEYYDEQFVHKPLEFTQDWVVLYEGDPQQQILPQKSRIFVPPIKPFSCVTRTLRIDMDCISSLSWSEIDAIKLIGIICDANVNNIPSASNSKLNPEYVEDLKTLFSNNPSTDCAILKLPIRKRLLASTTERPLFTIAPKIYYIHEFLLRYRLQDHKLLDKFIVKSEEEIIDMSPSVSGFSLTETAANSLFSYLYSGLILLPKEMFLDDDCDYRNAEELITEIHHLSESLGLEALRKACQQTMNIISVIPNHLRSGVALAIFNQFTSTSLSDDFYSDMRKIYEDSCTKGEKYDKRASPDVKIVFTMGSNEEDPLTPSSRPCIYAHSSILKARCAFFKTMFDWGNLSSPYRFSSNNIYEMEITDVKYDIFLLLIKYMYMGSLAKEDVKAEDAIPLYFAQNQYLLDSSITLSVIKDNISDQSVIDILRLSLECSYPEITELCLNYLLTNIETTCEVVEKAFSEKKQNATLESDIVYNKLIETSKIWEMVILHCDNLKYTSQWVQRVLAFSSEYTGWPASNVVGESNTYPNYGDIKSAWAPKASKGSLVKITAKNSFGTDTTDEVIYEGTVQTVQPVARIFKPSIDLCKSLNRTFNVLRLDIDTTKNISWYEIDAVKISGFIPKKTNDTCFI
ncbi:hypothetical protein C9374_013976 [Naegleria lovaniensis]|uniref:BTB domain-containing protein n=1 Tax=Naegleria lovaniensis TaxID=51637 RepID=A0AA88GVX1_NAELO|nr:uncharacterized protein C9374_013976 [Naegleria lovaniensis]KAG2389416.1 hypothetical protein C9374_013976 [Naegleria lovaniensis]